MLKRRAEEITRSVWEMQGLRECRYMDPRNRMQARGCSLKLLKSDKPNENCDRQNAPPG